VVTHPRAGPPRCTRMFHLRRALEPGRARGVAGDVLITRDRGYLLCVDRQHLDAALFQDGFTAGRAALEISRPSQTLCLSGKNQPWNGRFSTLPAGHQAGGAGPGRRRSACSAAQIPAEDLRSVRHRPEPPTRAKPHSNGCTASRAGPVAVPCCCNCLKYGIVISNLASNQWS
jgi:hypothetical protein